MGNLFLLFHQYLSLDNQYYHTQEKRVKNLTEPIYCTEDDAWLGDAWYLWFDESDADFWGLKKKRRTGKFQVYSCVISSDNILDTVFNKEHYFFWLKQIEKGAKTIIKKTNLKPTLKEINDYFKEKGIWTDLDGIQFQDISENPVHYMVDEFQYKKRIQLAVYNKDIILNFALHYEGECV